MPTYSYKGYDFEVQHSPTAEEFAQMSAYVDTLPPKQVKKEASWGTAAKSALAEASIAANKAIGIPAGALATYAGFRDQGDEIFRKIKEHEEGSRKWANPQQEDISFGQKVATAPLRIPGMFGAAASKGTDLIERGESLPRAMAATGTEAVLNAAGFGPMAAAKTVLGRAAIGATASAATGAGSDAATQILAQQESTKKAYDPYNLENRAIDAIVGGVFQGVAGERPPTQTASSNKIKALREEANVSKSPAPETQKPVTGYKPNDGQDGQMNLFDPEVEGRGVSPYEAFPGDWRVDENGIPIRADLSLEAQALQNPMQRGLWGDELDLAEAGYTGRDPTKPLSMDQDVTGYPRMSDPVSFKGDIENQRGLMEAIDNMDPEARTQALEQTQLGREMEASGPLEAAKMAAESLAPLGSAERKAQLAKRGMAKKQGGAIDPDVFLKDFPEFVASKIKDAAGKLKPLFRGVKEDYRAPERPMVGVLGEGIYLTESSTLANTYATGTGTGRHVKQAYVDIQKPYEMEVGSPEHKALLKQDETGRKEFSDSLKEQGYDGVILRMGNEMKEVSAFYPEQVKNAFSTPSAAIPKSQSGRVDVDTLLDVTTLGMWRLFNKDPAAMEASPDGSFIPTNPIAAEVLSNPINPKDDINVFTYTQSGAGSVAAKTKNPFVQAAFELVTNAGKRSEKAIREAVFPTEKQLRSLSKQELIDLSAVFKDEMFSGQKYDGELLAKHLSTAQLEAYNNLRNMFTKTLEAQNAARALEGKDPISEAEAYMSSRWEGRFRQPVYDSTGKLVWYLAADSKLGLSRQLDALKKQFPDLVVDPAKGHVVGSSKTGGDVISMYSKMLDILDRNDPAVADIKKYMEEVVALEAEGALAQTKHFKEKGNIRGFVGDRPGKEGTFKEAVAMFEQQLQYAKNAFTWSELQKVADPIKEIVASPELQNAQPNTVKFIREYTKAAFGLKESSTVRAVENRFSDALGVSPKVLSDAVGNLKSFFILQKLGFNLAYGAANVVQSANVIPYMANLLEQGYIGNPVGAMAKATLKMPALVAYHFSGISKDKVNNAPMSQFTKDMFKYAEDNGVIARSLAEEAPLAGGFSAAKRVGEVAASTMTVPEVMVRSFAFLSYADMLRQSGKFKNSIDIFKKAEELTNLSMVDYRPTERAMMFGKLGVTGDLLSTLQTYSFSYFNQFSHMTREAKEGKPLGLAAMAATHMALAGAMGVPYFNDLEKLYTLWRDKIAGNATYAKLMKSPFFSDPKLWIMENAGEGAVYGWLSDKTGLGLTSRVAAPALSEMVQAPGAPVVEMFNLGAAGLGALSGDKSKMGQAAMAITPPGLQGLLEQAPFMEGVTYSVDKDDNKVFFTSKDLSDKKGSYKRDEADAQKRNWGFRSQKEVLERDLAYRVSNAGNVSRQRSTALVEDIYTASRNGDKERVKELATLYTQLTGKELSEQQIKNQAWEEYSTLMNKNATKAKSPVELMTLGRALSIMENK